MPYTVWSRGRLLGHSDLEFRQCFPLARTGWFHPVEGAEPVLEVFNEPRRVILHARDNHKELVRADLAATSDRAEALELELRGDDGQVVRTEDVSIRDMDLTMEFAKMSDAREMFESSPEAELLGLAEGEDIGSDLFDFADVDDDEPYEVDEEIEWPKYQLTVCFIGHDRAMRALCAARHVGDGEV
ncbi:MAG: hypothetical protein ABIY52_05700 [Gemmatimonadaceae bacterium]